MAKLEIVLRENGEQDYIMSTTWAMTDKTDPMRTEANELARKVSAGLGANSGAPCMGRRGQTR
eukprot:570040-Pyramimonas_sp.AAC.1